MADVATLSVLLTARDMASGVMKKLSQNATQVGLSMVKLGAPLTAIGALSLKTFAGFEKSMVRVGAVSNATAIEFKALEAQAKLMQYPFDEFGTNLAIPPAPDTSSKWKPTITETSEDIEKIMQERPRHVRRVD